MEIQFLGTSSGTPTKSRNMSALAIRMHGARSWCLVDCGEATQHRLLHTRLSLAQLAAIFITHMHGDHCYGLPGLLASAGMLNRTEGLLLMGPPAVRDFVQCALDASQLRLPYPLEFIDVTQAPALDLLPDFSVRATPLSHRLPSFAYSFVEKAIERRLDVARLMADGIARGPAWGSLQRGCDIRMPDGRVVRAGDYLLAGRRPRKIIIGGDNDTPALLAAEAATTDVLVHEATYTEDILQKVGPGPQHSSAHRVARFAQDAGIANLVLTHFSPRYQAQEGGTSLSQLEAEARAAYEGRLFLANDLERYVLDREGMLARAPQ
ncbi:MAG TPA: MBL fold metallo-hydrolase [Noviherbaspirillum sp.]|jgi:ribonuclease Z|uniref:MBL fold metallo-hydrolase n=1 Tax=Noviherbaspirillum sp. TaxID=1926288 RepID=UPI002F95B395